MAAEALQESVKAHHAELESIRNALAQEQAALQEKKRAFEADIAQRFPSLAGGEPSKSGAKPGRLKLNVGGDRTFVAQRDTFTAFPGTRLAQIFSGRWDGRLPRDAEGRIFLDFHPAHFRALLGWMVDAKKVGPKAPRPPSPVEALPADQRWGFKELADYLGFAPFFGEAKPLPPSATPREVAACDAAGGGELEGGACDSDADDSAEAGGSAVLSSEAQGRLLGLLEEVGPHTGRKKAMRLLYRASRDGFAPQDFHQRCDGKGPTVTVAKSAGGHVFGGYVEHPWTSTGQYAQCTQAFLFRLEGSGAATSKHPIFQNHGNGMSNNASYGPTFGGNHDLLISNSQATFNLGHTYNRAGSNGVNVAHLAESQTVTIVDYEVFAV